MAEGTEIGPIKAAIEAIKAAVEILHPGTDSEKSLSRPGPLVVVGRFYVSLTLILATVTSVGAIVDWKSVSTRSPAPVPAGSALASLAEGATSQPCHVGVDTLRECLLVSICGGLLLSVVLVIVLMCKNALFLFSPTELSADAHQLLAPRTKEGTVGSTKAEDAPQKGPPTAKA